MKLDCTTLWYLETITYAQYLDLYPNMKVESGVAGFPFKQYKILIDYYDYV